MLFQHEMELFCLSNNFLTLLRWQVLLPGDVEHVAADFPQFLGQVIVRGGP